MVQYLDPVATTANERATALKSSRSEPTGSVEPLLYNHISRDIWSEVRGGTREWRNFTGTSCRTHPPYDPNNGWINIIDSSRSNISNKQFQILLFLFFG